MTVITHFAGVSKKKSQAAQTSFEKNLYRSKIDGHTCKLCICTHFLILSAGNYLCVTRQPNHCSCSCFADWLFWRCPSLVHMDEPKTVVTQRLATTSRWTRAIFPTALDNCELQYSVIGSFSNTVHARWEC